MKRFTTLAHAMRAMFRTPRTRADATESHVATPAEDYLVAVHLGGQRPGTVRFTRRELLEFENLHDLLVRAAERTENARPDPADFKDRPIGDYLDALGVPEDTARYQRERGVTTLHVRLGKLLREKP
ncbi:MAG TPA: hypothetical protein PKB03_00690 [Baekduia sp.]|nr:hypothetical protein [Baekduia sp.]